MQPVLYICLHVINVLIGVVSLDIKNLAIAASVMILVQIELRFFLIVQIMQPVVIILIAHLKLVGGVVILVIPLPVVRVLRSVQ